MDSNLHGFWLPDTRVDFAKKAIISKSIYLLRMFIPDDRENIACRSLWFICFWVLLSGKRLYKLSIIQLPGKSVASCYNVDILRPYCPENNLWIKWKCKEGNRDLHHSYLWLYSCFHFTFLYDLLDWSYLCKSWSVANQ